MAAPAEPDQAAAAIFWSASCAATRVTGEASSTEVRVGPLSSVGDAFAWDEGEGARTRDWWSDGHRAYFRRWFAATGKPPDDDPELLFERSTPAWPVERADP